MSLKRKQTLLDRKASFEQELADRLARLAEKGIKSPNADKNPVVRKLKAEIKASKRRLARIAEIDKRTEEMARIKAEKAAAPKVEPQAKPEKPKATAQEAKAKKPKSPEGGKAPKKPEAPGAEKAAPPKKAEA
jgi:capsule polysaccharide export protein KpsE/RkpR